MLTSVNTRNASKFAFREIHAEEIRRIKVEAGNTYKVVQLAGNQHPIESEEKVNHIGEAVETTAQLTLASGDSRTNETANRLAAEIIVEQQDDALVLFYANGAVIWLEGFFAVENASVQLPSDSTDGFTYTADMGSLVYSDPGESQLIYAYHSDNDRNLTPFTQTSGAASGDGAWSALSGLGALLGVAGGLIGFPRETQNISGTPVSMDADEPTVITGFFVAGPVLPAHGLTVAAYTTDGREIGTSTIEADGSYHITLTEDYSGPLLVRVVDTNTADDYYDEGSSAGADLTIDLRAFINVSGPGSYTVNVNVLTELAVRALGLTSGDDGASQTNLDTVTEEQVTASNNSVAQAFGLETEDELLNGEIQAIVDNAGTANPDSNLYGEGPNDHSRQCKHWQHWQPQYLFKQPYCRLQSGSIVAVVPSSMLNKGC